MRIVRFCAICLGILTIISLSGSTAHGLYHHVNDCSVCHYAGGAEASLCTACPNNAIVKCEINTPNSGLKDTVFGPYVTGEAPYNGVCEVCHTTTQFHRNDASGDHTHYASEDCMPCHKHSNEFGHGGGQGCQSCHGDALMGESSIEREGRYSAAHMASTVWSHGPEMLAEMQKTGLRWPTLSGRDVADLIAFLNEER